MFFLCFLWVSYVILGFLGFFLGFPRFSFVFHMLPMFFHGVPRLSCVFPLFSSLRKALKKNCKELQARREAGGLGGDRHTDQRHQTRLIRRTDLKNIFSEEVFVNFEVWVADRKVFDVRFDFSMSKTPRGQVLVRPFQKGFKGI